MKLPEVTRGSKKYISTLSVQAWKSGIIDANESRRHNKQSCLLMLLHKKIDVIYHSWRETRGSVCSQKGSVSLNNEENTKRRRERESQHSSYTSLVPHMKADMNAERP